MDGRPSPRFGKRDRATAAVPAPAAVRGAQPADPHRAFFDSVRAETQTPEAGAAADVPRSLRAAVLAGIVVACGLAGLDATEKMTTLGGLTEVVPGQQAQILVPALILLAVVGGGRSAATSLLLAHGVLSRTGRTGHLAYACGGAVAAAVVAAAFQLVLGNQPARGFAVDILAGAAGGFFYRVFAGTRGLRPRAR